MLSELIINNKYISIKAFTEKYKLSLRSIRQDLITLEEWLLHLNIELERHRKHGARLVLSESEQLTILKWLESEPVFLSGADRKLHMILMILNGEGQLTGFETKFDVSSNTIQNDISELKRFVSNYHLTIIRENNKMELVGEEVYIRHLFIDTLKDLFDEVKMMELIVSFNTEDAEIELILNRYFAFIDTTAVVNVLQGIEAKLDVEYTGSSLYYLFILLIVQFSRLFHGKFLPSSWLETKENLLETPEYQGIEEILETYSLDKISYSNKSTEVAFLTMYFISAKKEYEDIKSDLKFHKLAERLVHSFENKVEIKLSKKHKIIEGLALHLKPAIHRMKYDLKIENSLLEGLKKEYHEYIYIVNEIMEVEFKGMFESIDEHEIGFITIHLCSGLDNRVPTPKKKVAIVCSSGLGTSSLLESSLRRKFPQASVHGVYSLNEVKTLTKKNTDLILSTVSLRNLDVPWLKVSPFLDKFEALKVEGLLGVAQMEEKDEAEIINTVKNVHDLINKHAKIENESKLFRDLYHYFKGTTQQQWAGNITSLSHPSCMLFNQGRASWEEVIRELNERLVELNKTTPAYADELIQYITNNDHHFLIADGIVFPHLVSENIVNSGFSMMTCDPPVLFGPNKEPVWWVILLAAKNPYDHLPAIELLIEVVNNPKIINKLKQVNEVELVWEWLKEREVEEE